MSSEEEDVVMAYINIRRRLKRKYYSVHSNTDSDIDRRLLFAARELTRDDELFTRVTECNERVARVTVTLSLLQHTTSEQRRNRDVLTSWTGFSVLYERCSTTHVTLPL
ncbi:hypothetical protein EVAR_4684_1 [Eumeta japonica]|uniref:Uncharacterized protein n=1 Tax=Eumeta variegata TaxID=151549 RepID=A0A4C1WM86_EUMVA|nr:hypothetical protein EVAR_4684_1 [Eumeta japonica]